MDKTNPKLIVILGPTASGKSDMAVKLATKYNGEIVSADSRQIYKEMDIGTGKITKKEMQGIPHHLIDVASSKKVFTVAQYRKLALKAISKIQNHGKIPILCGGTGFYIQSVIDGLSIPEVKPDWALRKQLEKSGIAALYSKLKSMDLKRAKAIDKQNKRRIIRALEILIKTQSKIMPIKKESLPYPVLIIGIKLEKEELNSLIERRFLNWLKQGFLKEVGNLRKNGLSWKRIAEFGLHYKQASLYLQNKITYDEFVQKSITELQRYAKRQIVWFKRDQRIIWVKYYSEADSLVSALLS